MLADLLGVCEVHVQLPHKLCNVTYMKCYIHGYSSHRTWPHIHTYIRTLDLQLWWPFTFQAKQVDKLVQLLNSDRSKVIVIVALYCMCGVYLMPTPSQINAYVQCGKLKAAYLIAVRAKLVDEVRKISDIAFKAGQMPVREICEKWLQSNAPIRWPVAALWTLEAWCDSFLSLYLV